MKHEGAEEEEALGGGYVPTNLALNQCISVPIQNQGRLVDKCVLHMLFRKLNVVRYLEELRKYMFGLKGDVITQFMQMIFRDDIESSVRETSLSYINNSFEIALKLASERESEAASRLQFAYTEQAAKNLLVFNAFNVSVRATPSCRSASS